MIIPVDYAQVNHVYVGSGAPTGMQVTYGINHDLSPLDAQEIAQYLHEQWDDYILSQQSNTLTLERTLVKFGPNETGSTGEYSDPQAGTLSGAVTSPAVSMLIRKVTASGGRKHRGRMYFPGQREADIDEGGTFTTTQVGEVQNAFDGWMAKLATDELFLVLLHGDNTTPTIITAMAAQSVAATQRRRQRR